MIPWTKMQIQLMSDVLLEQSQKPREKDALYCKVFRCTSISCISLPLKDVRFCLAWHEYYRFFATNCLSFCEALAVWCVYRKEAYKEMIKKSHKGRKKCTSNAATILQLAIFKILVCYDGKDISKAFSFLLILVLLKWNEEVGLNIQV